MIAPVQPLALPWQACARQAQNTPKWFHPHEGASGVLLGGLCLKSTLYLFSKSGLKEGEEEDASFGMLLFHASVSIEELLMLFY